MVLIVVVGAVITYLLMTRTSRVNPPIKQGGADNRRRSGRFSNSPKPMQTIVDATAEDYADTADEAKARASEIPFSREPSELRVPYRERPNACKLSLHSGQRKLLLVEAEFLTYYGNLAKTVVYAGAAPGIHCRLLAKMFPEHTFELYDPRPFSKRLEGVSNIHLHQDYFTDAVATKWSSQPTLFMCDIRSGDSNESDFEDHIVTNMLSQMRWVNILKPKMSLLKFRLPFTPGTTHYLDGKILLQPWQPTMSTECRLVTDGSKTRDYDHTEHEQKLYRHNIAGRLQTYPHPLGRCPDVPGIDRCYDCTAEIMIICEWMRSRGVIPTVDNVGEKMREISDELNETLDKPPHGRWPDLPLPERLQECAKEFSGKQRPARVYTANKFTVKAV